jgi:hypothetical protein
MPIHLEAPKGHAHGPDGKGWNRLSMGGHMGAPLAQCALRPTSYAALRESQDTRQARWGGFGACVSDGQCDTCPVFQTAPKELRALDDRVLVRIHPHDGRLYLMNRPEDGWASGALRWTWAEVARLNGWEIGRRHHDEHSDGFWLERSDPA